MSQNNFDRPINSFSPKTDNSGSALHRLQERLGIGRREQAIILIVIGVAIFTGILFLFRPKQATPPPSAFSPLERHIGTINVTFTGSYEVPVKRVELFSVSEFIDQQSLLKTFAQRLNMKPAEYSLSGNTYTNDEGSATLSMASGDQGITYSLSSGLRSDLLPANTDAARVVAGNFLDNLGYITSELTLLEDQIQYFVLPTAGNEDLQEVPPEQAILIRLVYERQQNGLPLTFSASSIEKFTLDITADGLFSATLPNTFFTSESVGQYNVLSVEQALEQIKKGQFTIIGTTQRVQKENEFIEFRLDAQHLQYRFDPTTSVLFPVFRFSGTALTESYQELPIIVVTEAINVQDTANNDTVEPDLQNTAQPE